MVPMHQRQGLLFGNGCLGQSGLSVLVSWSWHSKRMWFEVRRGGLGELRGSSESQPRRCFVMTTSKLEDELNAAAIRKISTGNFYMEASLESGETAGRR